MKTLRGWTILAGVALALALLLALWVQPAFAASQVHVVQRGESLWTIAVRYGTTPQAIARANGLANGNLIYAGQRLTIPGSGGGGAASGGSYTVRAGDTLSAIAARYGTTASALARANGLGNASLIYVGQRLTVSGAGGASGGSSAGAGQTYVVRAGDTLGSIASRYGTTVAAIARANGISNPSYIYPGQRLRISSAGGGTTAPPAGGSGQRIVVDLSAQRMYVYYNGELVWNWVVSTGRAGQGTAIGHWKVLNKIPNAWASTWSLKMPYWLGIYWAGSLQNGIHALPIMSNGQTLWAGYLGTPASFGCIILSTENARTLYNWAAIGTPVDVVW
jgi:LysM repeat protein